MQVSLWEILSAISPLLAPIITLILALVGRIIWNHEQRLRNLERGKTRHSRSLYGDEEDDRQTGLSHDVTSMSDRVNHIDERVGRIEDAITDIEDHLSSLNGYDNE